MSIYDERPLGELIRKMLDSNNLSDKMTEKKIVGQWAEIVGELIASKTDDIYVSGQSLFVKVTSAPLKEELQFHKKLIIEKVNTFAGREFILQIIIR